MDAMSGWVARGLLNEQPLVINEQPDTCPTCGRSVENIASVYRDGGSTLYCVRCLDLRWPNPNHARGAAKLARLRREAGGD